MINELLSKIAKEPITGIVGAVTGILSLGWHILNRRSKIKVESFDFYLNDRNTISFRIVIKNKSDRSTTIERMEASLNEEKITVFPVPNVTGEYNLHGNSTRTFNWSGNLNKNEITSGDVNVIVYHTFGKLKMSKALSKQHDFSPKHSYSVI